MALLKPFLRNTTTEYGGEIESLAKSRLLRFVERAVVSARRAVPRLSARYSWKRFTLRQHVIMPCLRVKEATTYRDFVDELIEMPHIGESPGLDSISTPSTLCKAFDGLKMADWRVL